jgi:hypothetical protein
MRSTTPGADGSAFSVGGRPCGRMLASARAGALSSSFVYIFSFLYLGIKSKNPLIVAFFFLFFTCNLTDDFLIRFDGIIFSGFWLTIFSCYYMQKVKTDYIKNT